MEEDITPSVGWINKVEIDDVRMEISGWVASFDYPRPDGFRLEIGGKKYTNFDYDGNLPSPDVKTEHPNLLSAQRCGFRIRVPLSHSELTSVGEKLTLLYPVFNNNRGNVLVANVNPFSPLPSKKDLKFIGILDKKHIVYFLAELIDYGKLKPTDSVLDVGCGIGRMGMALTRYLTKEASYEGIDVHKKSIKWCIKNISKHLPNFKFKHVNIYNKHYNPKGKIKGSEFSFPYGDQSLDFIFLLSVFTHMFPEEIRHYLGQIKRTLKTGGRCLFTCFLMTPETKRLIEAGKSSIELKYNINDFYTTDKNLPELALGYDEESVMAWLAAEKFVVESRQYGSWCGRDKYISGQDFIVIKKR